MASPRSARAARLIVPLILAGWLAACGGESLTAFDLAAAPPGAHRALRASVRVREPLALGDLDSDRILVRSGPNILAVLAGARWAERLPTLLRARLIESFQNSRDVSAVGEGGSVSYDYNLETDLRAFELDADQKQVAIDLAVKIVSARDGRVVAAKVFKARAPVASTDGPTVVAALNATLSDLMAQIVSFVAASI